jgi:hypothetical protein
MAKLELASTFAGGNLTDEQSKLEIVVVMEPQTSVRFCSYLHIQCLVGFNFSATAFNFFNRQAMPLTGLYLHEYVTSRDFSGLHG